MEKRIFLLFALVILLSFTACGKSENNSGTSEHPNGSVSEETESLSKGETERKEGLQTETLNMAESEGGNDMVKYDFSVYKNVELIGVELSAMSDEQLAVLYQQARYCQAMTDADTDTLRGIVSEDAAFTHMSGKQQTREEYFKDIEKGRLRYFTIGIDSPVVEVDGKIAQITFTSVLNANAYGARGTYRMSGTHWFEKRDGNWISINDPDR